MQLWWPPDCWSGVPRQRSEQTGRVRVEVHAGVDPIAAAEVVVLGVTQLTDDQGVAIIRAPRAPSR